MKIFFLFLVASTAVLAAPVDKKTEELINAGSTPLTEADKAPS